MSDSCEGKQQLIHKLIEAGGRLQQHFGNEDDEEKQWLHRHNSNPVLEEILKESTITMLHVIDAIGKLEPTNGASISKAFGIPKGSVSKITKKLVRQKLIQTEHLPHNKKEVLFRLTALGRELFELHRELHKQMNKGIIRFLEQYSEEELLIFLKGFEDTMKASWFGQEPGSEAEPISDSTNLEEAAGPSMRRDIASSSKRRDEELNEVIAMLQQLNASELRKAKAIVREVFLTSYEGD
ncbi:winged helix DNA-binding protein [Paenibacillus sp. HB172176]|uniref:MarR family winged helix-turn-helix transcriptional regulator n=1 Tax=Paenibacillus sp. HB172176 TaxID=2493690 RepID=UPI00143C13F9|nr:winged helix DNA-binding protein [Paenibacillus sp. HB172176]